MKNNILYICVLSLLVLSGCKKYEDAGFLDGPTVEDLLVDPSFEDLVLLTKGVEAQAKVDQSMYVDLLGILGREAYDLNGSDPRYTGELLGKDGAQLDNGGFLTTRSYSARYRTVLQANNVLLGLSNSTDDIPSTTQNGIKGFVNTMKANALLLNLNMQNENGVRIDVADADNLGPFLDKAGSLSAIYQLLGTASAELLDAGDEFGFTLGSGFASFSTPATFNQFNRALAARVALYQGDNAKVLVDLDNSFFDLNGDMNTGGYLSFNANDGINNALAHTDDFMAHPSYFANATENDSRLSKIQINLDPMSGDTVTVSFDGLSSDYKASIYVGNGDNQSIIRNEELILIYAEANVVSNSVDAIIAINIVRNAAGIGNYIGGGQQADLMNEIAYQRRYSLFGEAHRWIDMRRWDRLNELPLDRTGDAVHVQFPRPFGE